MSHEDPIVPYPEPPTIALRSPLVLATAGALHLLIAAFSDAPQVLHQGLAVLEIGIAIWIFVEVSRWQKAHAARRRTPPPAATR